MIGCVIRPIGWSDTFILSYCYTAVLVPLWCLRYRVLKHRSFYDFRQNVRFKRPYKGKIIIARLFSFSPLSTTNYDEPRAGISVRQKVRETP